MSDSVIIYLSNFLKGVMRALAPRPVGIPSIVRREKVIESNPERIGYYGFMGTVQKGL